MMQARATRTQLFSQ